MIFNSRSKRHDVRLKLHLHLRIKKYNKCLSFKTLILDIKVVQNCLNPESYPNLQIFIQQQPSLPPKYTSLYTKLRESVLSCKM